MNVDRYLSLDRAALDALPVRDRWETLGELAQTAGAWIRRHRAALVEQLRDEGHSDTEVAELLGVTPSALSDMGDGPVIYGVRPRLLRQGAELLVRVEMSQTGLRYAMEAVELLGAGRPTASKLWSAAQRITMAAKNISRPASVDTDLSEAERALLARAVGHAAVAVTRLKELPPGLAGRNAPPIEGGVDG